MERTTEQWEKLVRFKDDKIGELDEIIRSWNEIGLALSDYQEDDIKTIRQKMPKKTAKYSDREIARAYSWYCEDRHGAGWTGTDLDKFCEWAFHGGINEVI